MRKSIFMTRLSSGAFTVAVVVGAALLTEGVSDAAPSAGIPQVIAAAPTTTKTKTTTKLEVSPPSPVASGTPVKLTATISPVTAAGTVQFQDGTAPLGGPIPVSNGTASTSTSALMPGTHSLTAVFTPSDPTLTAGSTSAPVSFMVNSSAPSAPSAAPAPPTGAATARGATILTQSTASMDLLPSPEVELAAKLTEANGKPIPGRVIDFYGGNQLLCRHITDTYGSAQCSGAENFGPQTAKEILTGYEAVFSGDENYEPSSQHASATIGTGRSKQ